MKRKKAARRREYIADCADCVTERLAIPLSRIRAAAKIIGCSFKELKAALNRGGER